MISFHSSFHRKLNVLFEVLMLSEFCYTYNFAYYFTFIKYLALEVNHVYDVKLLILQENFYVLSLSLTEEYTQVSMQR